MAQQLSGAVGKRGEPESLSEVLSRLEDGKGAHRASAAQDLARLYPEAAGPALSKMTDDEDWRVRAVVYKAYFGLLGRDSWDRECLGLSDKNQTAAQAAWSCVRKMSRYEDVEQLRKLEATAHPRVRRSIALRVAHLEARQRQRMRKS